MLVPPRRTARSRSTSIANTGEVRSAPSTERPSPKCQGRCAPPPVSRLPRVDGETWAVSARSRSHLPGVVGRWRKLRDLAAERDLVVGGQRGVELLGRSAATPDSGG